MTEFFIPLRPEDLKLKSEETNFGITSEIRYSIDFAERIIHDLSFNEPLCILDQTQFEGLYRLIEEFNSLAPDLQNALLEGLASSLKMLSTEDSTSSEQRRSAIKMYVFFLTWVWGKILESMEKQSQTTSTPARRRKTLLQDHTIDWRQPLEGSLISLAGILSTDLKSVWSPGEVDHRMLELILSFAKHCLASGFNDLAKRPTSKRALFDVFAFIGVKYQFLQQAASALVIEIQKNEALVSLVAELALHVQELHKTDDLTGALIQEITKASPQDYSQQWDESRGRSISIKGLGKFMEALGEVLADCLIRHSSALEAYWSCTAYPIRNALVSIMGAMIQTLNHPNGRDQQHQMLDRLMQRFLDVSAFTRARCLGVWVILAQRSCVPMEYWIEVTKLAVERLRDSASTVRKAALTLLQALIEYNPFGDNMNRERFLATLQVYKAKLQDHPADQKDQDAYQQLIFVVQNLETAVSFTELLEESLEISTSFLSNSSIIVVQEVVHFCVVCKQFSVRGVEQVMKSSFVLVFSQEASLRDQIIDAFLKLYIDEEDDLKTAQNLSLLAMDVRLGELTCLEEIIRLLLINEKLKMKVIRAFLLIALNKDSLLIPKPLKVQASTFFLSVCAPHCPSLLVDHLDSLIQIAFVENLDNGIAVSYTCQILKHLNSHLEQPVRNEIWSYLVQVLFENHMSQASWFQVAEHAIGTLYVIYPQPDELFEEILYEMATSISTTPTTHIQSISYLRFCFLLSQVAIHHMLNVDICTEIVKRKLSAGEEVRSDEEELDNPLGGQLSRQELELENLRNEIEIEVMNPRGLIGFYASMIASVCGCVAEFVELPTPIQVSLSFGLVKLMTINLTFCQDNLQLLFTLLYHKSVPIIVKENLVIAMADLIVRFPNLMEPWAPRIYDLLQCEDLIIRRNALLVLTHLILSDMIKVQGHISKMVILMREDDIRLRTMAKTFIHELHKKSTRTSNPIYNLFSDILSNFQRDRSLSTHDFQMIIQYLLKFTNEKHGEKLVEKLSLRFEGVESVETWRGLSFSIKCLQLGEKGFYRMRDMVRSYRHSLGDVVVFRHFKEAIGKLRRNTKLSEFKPLINEFEKELASLHEELKPEEEVMEMDEAVNGDEESEITLRRTTTLSGSFVEQNVLASDRKRKAEEQDELERRSEMRLLGRSSRLDRIPEKNKEVEKRSFSFGTNAILPAGPSVRNEIMDVEEPVNDTQSLPSDDSKVERRLSRLSISEIDT